MNISRGGGTVPSICRYPVNRSGNNAGRVKRVVSCKRKSHHPLARRKQPGKTFFPSNDDGQQEPLVLDSLEFPVNTINRGGTGDAGLDQDECSLFSEVRHIVAAVTTHRFGSACCFFGHNYKVQTLSALARSRNNGGGAVWEEPETPSVFNPLAQKCGRAVSILSKVQLKYIFLPVTAKRHYLFRCLTIKIHFLEPEDILSVLFDVNRFNC